MIKSTTLHLLAGTCLLGLATEASAQSEQAAPAGTAARDNLETIVVTARRRDEELQDVPLVVNAVTSEDVEKLNLRNFQEVQNVVPGLRLSIQPGSTGGQATLRGVNFDIQASVTPTVEFYYNDAPIASVVLLQSLFDVGQIEVLRGPQGTLRGKAAPSGSITFTSRRPDLDEIGGSVNATANDIGTINVNGGFNIPIIPGVASIRVAGLTDYGDGNGVKTINGGVDRRDPESKTNAGRITARIEPFDWLKLDGSYQRLDYYRREFNQVESDSEFHPTTALPSPVLIRAKDDLAIGSGPETQHLFFDIYNGQMQIAAADQRLIYVYQRAVQNGIIVNAGDPANVFPTTGGLGQTVTNLDKPTTTHELRLQNDARVFGMFDYVIGMLDSKSPDMGSTIINKTIFANPPPPGGAPGSGGFQRTLDTVILREGYDTERSYFGNITAHIDDFELSGGLRHIHHEKGGSTKIGAGAVNAEPDEVDNKIIYAATAKYQITPDVMIYANTGTSFRPSVFAIGNFSVGQNGQGLSAVENSHLFLPPETSRSYELGFKSTLFDRRLRLNGTVYHQEFKNYPYRAGANYISYSATPANGVAFPPSVANHAWVSATNVEVNGVEAEIAFTPSDRFGISVSAAYALGKVKNGLIACLDLNDDGIPDDPTALPPGQTGLALLQADVGANNVDECLVNQRSANSAPFSATVQSEYRLPIWDNMDSYLRGLLSFNGKSQGSPTSSLDNVSSYSLLNLYTGLRDTEGRWELSFFAKNVLDLRKVTNRTTPISSSFRQPATVSVTTTYVGVGVTPGREFGVNFRFNFGSG